MPLSSHSWHHCNPTWLHVRVLQTEELQTILPLMELQIHWHVLLLEMLYIWLHWQTSMASGQWEKHTRHFSQAAMVSSRVCRNRWALIPASLPDVSVLRVENTWVAMLDCTDTWHIVRPVPWILCHSRVPFCRDWLVYKHLCPIWHRSNHWQSCLWKIRVLHRQVSTTCLVTWVATTNSCLYCRYTREQRYVPTMWNKTTPWMEEGRVIWKSSRRLDQTVSVLLGKVEVCVGVRGGVSSSRLPLLGTLLSVVLVASEVRLEYLYRTVLEDNAWVCESHIEGRQGRFNGSEAVLNAWTTVVVSRELHNNTTTSPPSSNFMDTVCTRNGLILMILKWVFTPALLFLVATRGRQWQHFKSGCSLTSTCWCFVGADSQTDTTA